MLTRQEIFDKALAGIVAQGCQSTGPDGCLYYTKRAGKVLKCAIGHLVPDEVAIKWETEAMHSPAGLPCLIAEPLGVQQSLREAGVSTEGQDFYFLCHLQDAHDMGKGLEGIIENFRRLAEQYNLTFNLPSNP